MQDYDEFRPSWVNMSEAKLRKLLTEQKYPAALMMNIFSRVRDIKAKRKAERTRMTVLQQRWDDVLRPARTELATVRTMKAQTTKILMDKNIATDVRDKYAALCAYEEVLVEVIQKLRKYQQEKDEEKQYTPQQVAKLLREAGKRAMPTNGTHWTDYVGGTTRRRIEKMFDDLPEARRGKRKVPFEHRISPQEFDRLRKVLVGQLFNAQHEAETMLAIVKDPQERAKFESMLSDVQYANYRLEILSRTSPLPATWRGLL